MSYGYGRGESGCWYGNDADVVIVIVRDVKGRFDSEIQGQTLWSKKGIIRRSWRCHSCNLGCLDINHSDIIISFIRHIQHLFCLIHNDTNGLSELSYAKRTILFSSYRYMSRRYPRQCRKFFIP